MRAHFDALRRARAHSAHKVASIGYAAIDPKTDSRDSAAFSIASVYSGFSQSARLIGSVQKTPPSEMVWLPPASVARISNS